MARRARKGDTVKVKLPDGQEKTFVDGGSIDLDEEVVLDWDGTRITEARAQEMAENALKHFDELDRRQGRPALDRTVEKGTRSPQVAFRVPHRLAQRAGEVAASQGKTLSQLGREALEKYLEEIA